jgi:predicted NAD-dependent protein-ADP-ribosyltransferase YbiA (DUF1768 family)
VFSSARDKHFGFLSNMTTTAPIQCDSRRYASGEHFYQSEKYRRFAEECTGDATRQKALDIAENIRLAKKTRASPKKAKRVAKETANQSILTKEFVEKWENGLQVEVMRQTLDLKFSADSAKGRLRRAKLLKTGHARIIQKVKNCGRFWAVIGRDKEGNWIGQNMLGRLLMEKRTQIEAESWEGVVKDSDDGDA